MTVPTGKLKSSAGLFHKPTFIFIYFVIDYSNISSVVSLTSFWSDLKSVIHLVITPKTSTSPQVDCLAQLLNCSNPQFNNLSPIFQNHLKILYGWHTSSGTWGCFDHLHTKAASLRLLDGLYYLSHHSAPSNFTTLHLCYLDLCTYHLHVPIHLFILYRIVNFVHFPSILNKISFQYSIITASFSMNINIL